MLRPWMVALAVALGASQAEAAESIEHGSRKGAGTSRGPGAGDGTGKRAAHESDAIEEQAEPELSAEGELPTPFELAIGDDVRFDPIASYRLRYLHEEGRDFRPGAAVNALRHRARLGLSGSWRDRVRLHLEIQDVRQFGEEQDTLDASADGLDLHQGYAAFVPIDGLELRAGRQAIGFANQRLVGEYDYLEQARSFDAFRFRYAPELPEGVLVDAFVALVRRDDVGLGGGGAIEEGEAGVAGVQLRYALLPELRPSVIAVGDRDERDGRRVGTAGALFDGDVGAGLLRWQAEGYYQFGRADGDVRISAFLVAAQTRVTLERVPTRPFIELRADFASGDEDEADDLRTSFAAPFADAHSFFGEMDQFVDLPRDTGEHGLRDLGGGIGLHPLERMELCARHHLFQSMVERGDLVHFGHELDLIGDYRFWDHVRVSAVYAVFFPGSLLADQRDVPAAEPEHFAHVTLGVEL